MKNVSLTLRFTLFFVIFVIAVIAVIITTSIQQFNDAARMTSIRLGFPIAKRAVAAIDGDAFERLSKTLDPLDPFYEETRLKLLVIKEETQCLYLYTMAPGEGNMYRFIIDGGNPGEEGFSPLGAGEDTSDYDKAFRLVWETKTPQTGVLDLQRTWGYLIATYMPILNSAGDMVGIVGCDFEAESIFSAILDRIKQQVVLSAGLILTGFLLYLFLLKGVSRYNRRLLEASRKAEAASESKSVFLAKMSHEIRTPMNAVIGMTDILLRQELPGKAYGQVVSIKQAAMNLLAIINDILDFSKIESGKMEISPADYEFSSLINDVITIIRMRLREKPVYFVVNVDSAIPKKLYGDVVRVRQILLNLLSNATKYTNNGHIIFTVDTDKSGEDTLTLKFEIADTGIGIKQEDIGELFGNFTRLDSRVNQGVEGTGLGLAITRSLCRAMGGDVAVESEYGAGSTFTAHIPQGIRDKTPFAAVTNPETKNVLIYETREVYGSSIVCSVDNLGVSCKLVSSSEDFAKALEADRFDFIFAASFLFDEAQKEIQRRGIDSKLVLLAEYGDVISERQARFIAMPAYSINIANILNGVEELRGYSEDNSGIRFTAPEARVLIVDDIKINLDVAEGLLAPYTVRVDSCLGGEESIRLVQANSYDLILMDHMMPGMDGIEAAAAIHAWEETQRRENPADFSRKTPIIALTANAISGMKEMFLGKGFNDYLSKPIEIAKLDDIISRWIPAEKKIKAGRGIKRETFRGETEIVITGVDVKQGIAMTGGTEAGYRKVLAQFYKDAAERLPVFAETPGETIDGDNDPFPKGKPDRKVAEHLSAFAAQAHAIKSAAGTIGAVEVSAEAAALEAAGKAGDIGKIREILPVFYKHLEQLIEGIVRSQELGMESEEWRVQSEESEGKIGPHSSLQTPHSSLQTSHSSLNTSHSSLLNPHSPLYTPQLLTLKEALEAKNMKEIDKLLEEIEWLSLDAETRERINVVSDKVLMGEYEGAIAVIESIMAGETGK